MPLFFAQIGGDAMAGLYVLGGGVVAMFTAVWMEKLKQVGADAERQAEKAQREEDRKALKEDRELALQDRKIVADKVAEVAVAAAGVAEKTDHLVTQTDHIVELTNSNLTEVKEQVKTLTDTNAKLHERLQASETERADDRKLLHEIKDGMALLMERSRAELVTKTEIVQPPDKPVPVRTNKTHE